MLHTLPALRPALNICLTRHGRLLASLSFVPTVSTTFPRWKLSASLARYRYVAFVVCSHLQAKNTASQSYFNFGLQYRMICRDVLPYSVSQKL